MLETITWIAIAISCIVAYCLVVFIQKQWQIIKNAEQQLEQQEQAHQQQRAHTIESVQVLAKCMLEDQVELSEGCFRIKVLLDSLAPELYTQEPYKVFNTMYEGLHHMPTHEARKQTDKRFIYKLDKQRFALEDQHREQILQAS